MACDRCEELHLTVAIRTSGELRAAVGVIQANLDDGTLRQESLTAVGASSGPLRRVGEDGTWDDLVWYQFSCRSCGARFELSVETYHGRGGEWRPIDQ